MKTKLFLLILVVGALFVSCGEEPKTAEEVARDYIQMLHNGESEAIVNTFMQDSMPEEYRDLMVARMAQLSGQMKAQEGQLKDIQTIRTEEAEDHANVFLRLVYEDNHTQDVALTFLKQGERWMIY